MKKMLLLVAVAGLMNAQTALAKDHVPFITGGIGKEERHKILAKRDKYNLQIRSFLTGGEYTGDVLIQIIDAAGVVLLNELTDGPYFMANLQPGTYQVKASYRNVSHVKSITIAPGGAARDLSFAWSVKKAPKASKKVPVPVKEAPKPGEPK